MPDVQMPDGTVIRDVPDGTTKSQLMARYQKAQAGEASSNYNKSNFSQAMSGVNEGIANTIGAPVDIVNAGLGALGVKTSPKPVLGSAMIRDALVNMGSIGPEVADAGSKFIRRVGQSVGGAVIPIAGTATTAAQAGRMLIPAISGGIGAATANRIAPGNPWADLAGDVVGSLIGGGYSARLAKNAAQAAISKAVPDIATLKQKTNDLYNLAERNGIKASKVQTGDLAHTFRSIASDEGLISPTGRVSEAYPKAKEALQLVNDYSTGEMSPKQMQTVRKVLQDAASNNDNSERRIAVKMLEQFDDWAAPLAPELAQARAVARRYISAGKIDKATELAASRAGQFSGSGYENALRTEFRNLDRQIIRGDERGFNPDTVQAIRNVARGTAGSNTARAVGKLAPTGVVSAGLATGVPFFIGNAIGGPVVGAGLGGATNLAGVVGRNIATKMGIKNAQMADLIARNGGKLPPPLVLNDDARRAISAFFAGQGLQQGGRNEKQNRK